MPLNVARDTSRIYFIGFHRIYSSLHGINADVIGFRYCAQTLFIDSFLLTIWTFCFNVFEEFIDAVNNVHEYYDYNYVIA